MSRPATLLESLSRRAREHEDRAAFLCVEHPGAQVTYGELWASAQGIAEALLAATAAGDRVALVFQSGLDFVPAFYGTLLSGRIAVPCPPPEPTRPERAVRRFESILEDARPALVLTDASCESWVRRHCERPLVVASRVARHDGNLMAPGRYAYLQYTSGSTAEPRGVMVTHDNLVANCGFVERQCGFGSTSILVSWVPQSHDQGLVYGVCQPLYSGFPCVLMSPETFIARPRVWLETISRYHATHAGGPNFAYDVAVRKVASADRAGLDLASWSCAYAAAEPVRAATLDAFADAYAPYGFRRDAFQPCYGLAEATLRVAASRFGTPPRILSVDATDLAAGRVRVVHRGDRGAVDLVGHGPAEVDHRRIVVVDPSSGCAVGSDCVGELWVSGPDVADGYWQRPEESRAIFAATTLDGHGPMLRTGDAGFVNDCELYIAGRLKDLIIIRGVNYYPQDIELTVEQTHPTVRPGCVAAFGIDHGDEERLVVVAEVRPGPDRAPDETAAAAAALRSAIQRSIAERHGLALHDFVTLRPSTIPKTPSGKLQRQECRRRYLASECAAVAARRGVAAVDPPDVTGDAGPADGRIDVALVLAVVRKVVDAAIPIEWTPTSPLAEYLDSFSSIELVALLESALGITIDYEQLTAADLESPAALTGFLQRHFTRHHASVTTAHQ